MLCRHMNLEFSKENIYLLFYTVQLHSWRINFIHGFKTSVLIKELSIMLLYLSIIIKSF